MRAGRLRHKIWINKYSPTTLAQTNEGSVAYTPLLALDTDEYGTSEYGQIQYYWGEIIPLTGRELVNAQEVIGDVSHKITLRWTPHVNRQDQIIYLDGSGVEHTYEVEACLNPDMRCISVVCMSHEIT